jgi:hypothetical protein
MSKKNELNYNTYMTLLTKREELKANIGHLQSMLVDLQLELSQSDLKFNFLDSIYNPKVSIQEVNNEKMGHRYLGRVRVLDPNGKSGIVLGFSVGRVDHFKGIDDPKLIKLARDKAVEVIQKKYSIYFS